MQVRLKKKLGYEKLSGIFYLDDYEFLKLLVLHFQSMTIKSKAMRVRDPTVNANITFFVFNVNTLNSTECSFILLQLLVETILQHYRIISEEPHP